MLDQLKFFLSERQFLLAMLLIFLDIAVGVAINSYGTSLFLATYPASDLAYLYFFQALTLVIVTLITTRFESVNPRGFALGNQITYIAAIIFFQFFLSHGRYTPFIYCIILFSIFELNWINMWNLVCLGFNLREFKAVSNILAMAGTIAGIIFGYSLPLIVKGFGILSLPVLLVIMLAISCYPILKLNLIIPPPVVEQKANVDVTKYPLFRNIFFYIILEVIISTLVDYNLKSTLALDHSEDKIAEFMAIFFASVCVLTLIIQVFLVRRLITWLNMAGLLVVLPIVTVVTALLMFISPTLFMASVMALLNVVIIDALNNISPEVVLNVLPSLYRIKAKSLIKGLANPIAITSGAAIIWLASRYFNSHVISLIVCALSVPLLLFSLKVKTNYKKGLQDALVLQRFDTGMILQQFHSEAALQDMVISTLQNQDPAINLLGLSMVPKANFSFTPPAIKSMITSNQQEVKLAAIHATQYIKDAELTSLLVSRLKQADEPEEISALLYALFEKDAKAAYLWANQLLNHPHPRVRATAIHTELLQGNLASVGHAIAVVQNMLRSPQDVERSNAAEILGEISIGNLTAELVPLIGDKSAVVSIHAIYAATHHANQDLIDAIAEALSRHEISYHAAHALAKWGKSAIPAIMKQIYAGRTLNTKIAAIQALALMNDAAADQAFIELTNTVDFFILFHVAKQLAYRAEACQISIALQACVKSKLIQTTKHIQLMKSIMLQLENPLQKHELNLRINLVSKMFLYWLAILNDPAAFLPIIPVLSNGFEKNDDNILASSLELIETSLHQSEYAKYITLVYETEPASGVLADQLLELKQFDPWLADFINLLAITPTKKGKEMDNIEKIVLLRKTKLFRHLTAESMLVIVDFVTCKEVSAEEIIYREGEIPNALYIIGQGEIELSRAGKNLVTLKDGQFFGFIGVLKNEPWDVNAKALTPGLLLCIEKQAFDRIIEDIPDVLMALTQVLLVYLQTILKEDMLS